jgi:hypothetical protein
LIVRKRKRYMGVKGKGKGKGELVKIFGLADCSDQLISDSILRFSSAATGEMPSFMCEVVAGCSSRSDSRQHLSWPRLDFDTPEPG